MCLAIPVQVKEIIDDETAVVETALIDDVRVGDYVILHVGYALQKIDPIEAQKTLELFAQASQPA